MPVGTVGFPVPEPAIVCSWCQSPGGAAAWSRCLLYLGTIGQHLAFFPQHNSWNKRSTEAKQNRPKRVLARKSCYLEFQGPQHKSPGPAGCLSIGPLITYALVPRASHNPAALLLRRFCCCLRWFGAFTAPAQVSEPPHCFRVRKPDFVDFRCRFVDYCFNMFEIHF